MAILSSQHLYEIKKMYAEVHKSLENENREKIEGLDQFWLKLEPYLYEEDKKQKVLRTES